MIDRSIWVNFNCVDNVTERSSRIGTVSELPVKKKKKYRHWRNLDRLPFYVSSDSINDRLVSLIQLNTEDTAPKRQSRISIPRELPVKIKEVLPCST